MLKIGQVPMPPEYKKGTSDNPKHGPYNDEFVPLEEFPDTENLNPEEALLAKEEAELAGKRKPSEEITENPYELVEGEEIEEPTPEENEGKEVVVHSRPPIIGSGRAGREAQSKFIRRTHQDWKHKGMREADMRLQTRRKAGKAKEGLFKPGLAAEPSNPAEELQRKAAAHAKRKELLAREAEERARELEERRIKATSEEYVVPSWVEESEKEAEEARTERVQEELLAWHLAQKKAKKTKQKKVSGEEISEKAA